MKHQMDSYKKSMDSIKADNDFREKLLKNLDAEKKRLETRPKKSKIFYPLTASVAAAAVLMFTIYFSKSLLLPLLRHDEFELSHGETNKEVIITKPNNKDTVVSNPVNVYDETLIGNSDIVNDSQGMAGNEQENQPEISTPQYDSEEVSEDSYSGATAMNNVDYSKPHSAVSYAGAVITPRVGTGTEVITYDSVFHFTFEGFDKYDVGLRQNDIIFDATLDCAYTLEDFFADYYNIIIAKPGIGVFENGLVVDFFDVTATDDININVYVNGIEVINLKSIPLSSYKDMNDVYFNVSVT